MKTYHNSNIVFMSNKISYSCRVSSFGINQDGTPWKEVSIWRKAINDNLNTLSERKQLVELPNGGIKIMSSPLLPPITIPFELRSIPVAQWRDEDRIWLNM